MNNINDDYTTFLLDFIRYMQVVNILHNRKTETKLMVEAMLKFYNNKQLFFDKEEHVIEYCEILSVNA